MENKIQKVASHFEMGSALFKSAEVYGTGHINETYRVIYTENGQDHPYIFQKINTNIFKKPDQLMDNMARVLEQSAKSLADHPDKARRCIHLVPARDGKKFYWDENGCWRVYHFISGARTYDILETEELPEVLSVQSLNVTTPEEAYAPFAKKQFVYVTDFTA